MKLTLSILTLLVCTLQVAHARDWSDASGQYHREGTFLGFDGARVSLVAPDGKRISCRWDDLSAADQEYVSKTSAPGITTPQTPKQVDSPNHQLSAQSTIKDPVVERRTAQLIPAKLTSEHRVASATFSSLRMESLPVAGKRIFSGCFGTFQLNGATGTGAYWLRDNNGVVHHYVTSLTFHGHDGSGKYLVYTSVGLEGGVYGWYFYDQEVCGCCNYAVYMIGAVGDPEFYECSCREIPE
jgi:hypothetical protein